MPRVTYIANRVIAAPLHDATSTPAISRPSNSNGRSPLLRNLYMRERPLNPCRFMMIMLSSFEAPLLREVVNRDLLNNNNAP